MITIKEIKGLNKSMLINKIYLAYLVVHLIITLCFLVYFINLGLPIPYFTDEYSKVLGVFCYICIFGFIIIILEVSAVILAVVTVMYMIAWYFVAGYKKKKLNSTEQNNINDIH